MECPDQDCDGEMIKIGYNSSGESRYQCSVCDAKSSIKEPQDADTSNEAERVSTVQNNGTIGKSRRILNN